MELLKAYGIIATLCASFLTDTKTDKNQCLHTVYNCVDKMALRISTSIIIIPEDIQTCFDNFKNK